MPRPIPSLTDRQIERFNTRVVRGETGCWEWSHRISARGYGEISLFGQHFRAHRIAYALHTGSDPGDQLVCHSCDNPKCVNPEHLWLGTPLDNMRDMHIKGRARCNTPETHGHIYSSPAFLDRWRAGRNGNSGRGYPEFCRACGHHRTDDYVQSDGTRRCRECNRRRCVNRTRRNHSTI